MFLAAEIAEGDHHALERSLEVASKVLRSGRTFANLRRVVGKLQTPEDLLRKALADLAELGHGGFDDDAAAAAAALVDELVEQAELKQYDRAGVVLVKRGQRPKGMLVVVRGRVDVRLRAREATAVASSYEASRRAKSAASAASASSSETVGGGEGGGGGGNPTDADAAHALQPARLTHGKSFHFFADAISEDPIHTLAGAEARDRTETQASVADEGGAVFAIQGRINEDGDDADTPPAGAAVANGDGAKGEGAIKNARRTSIKIGAAIRRGTIAAIAGLGHLVARGQSAGDDDTGDDSDDDDDSAATLTLARGDIWGEPV